jgi:adenylate cyclase
MDPSFVESIRLRYFDTLILSKDSEPSNIFTVNINEQDLARYGQWPLPRNIYAEIIEDLYKRNAGLVVFNVLMPNPDRSGQDSVLANTLKKYPVILPSAPSDQSRNTPKNPGSVVLGPEFMDRIVSYPGLIANIQILENSAAGIGIVNTLPEIDGVNRRVPLIIVSNNKIYSSLSLETLRVLAQDSTIQVKLNEAGVEKMRVPKFGPIDTDHLGRIWIDWSQKTHSVNLKDMPENFNNSIVVVGVTAAGLSNPVPTSKGAVFPHEAQAGIIATMVNGVTIKRPYYADIVELASMAVMGILLLFFTRWIYVGLSAVVMLVVFTGISSYIVYQSYLFLFDITALIVCTLLVALHAYGAKFVNEFLLKQQIKRQFGTYLSPDLVLQLQKNPELLQLGGEEQPLTIMFTDVRGFTSISEHYGKDVQGLTKIMNRYMTAMTRTILENKGTLDKYIGDAQMAFWNAPIKNPDHAKLAVKTAIKMLEDLNEFNKEIREEGVPPFGMGLGINSGIVVVGNMGSEQRFDYTCLGDAVNLASRLEGQSKSYGVKIILGEDTAKLVKNDYDLFELDTIAVKGKQQGIRIFTIGKQTDEQNAFLYWYREGKWADAIRICEREKNNNKEMSEYYEIMLARLLEGKPKNWNGTYIATSK